MPKPDSNKSNAPPVIRSLVEKFAEHSETYHRTGYNETLRRRDFLDPFLEPLGWDMTNRQGYAEAYRDVIHEDALVVERYEAEFSDDLGKTYAMLPLSAEELIVLHTSPVRTV
jgi:hypothetical protein